MIFRASTMFVSHIMPRIRFNNETKDILDQFQKKTPIVFAQTLDLIRTTIQGNALMTVFSTNWKLVVAEKGKGKNASFHSVPVSYVSNTEPITSCSCATSRTCTMPAKLFSGPDTPYYTFEGLVLGCYSLETALLSSLSCFYSIKCMNEFRRAFGTNHFNPEELSNRTGKVIQLDAAMTRFSTNDTVETMAYKMFIESWASNVSYERFFNSCSPSYCTYTVRYRFDALQLLTAFLSVYVGLSVGIRFIVPHLVQMIKKIRNRFRVAPL